LDVNINEDISIASLKEELSKQVQIPAAEQKLIHAEHMLQNNDTVKRYGIKEGGN
jgi:hypothetical protein